MAPLPAEARFAEMQPWCHPLHVLVTRSLAPSDGAVLKVAERRKRSTYPELARGPQRLLVLGSEIGGRWNEEWQRWGALSVAIQLAMASSALGSPWPAAPQQGPKDGPFLDRVLDLASKEGPSRLPLRP